MHGNHNGFCVCGCGIHPYRNLGRMRSNSQPGEGSPGVEEDQENLLLKEEENEDS